MQQPLRPCRTPVSTGDVRTYQEEPGTVACDAGTASLAPGGQPGAGRPTGGRPQPHSVTATAAGDRTQQEARR
ncbi:hypothetical protein [Kitasatospora indigofera]|uniref:hypothetical protein n=1 Tax=Kitasatospora indigofera TaxID=67307 RepID=UPI0036A1DAE5